MGIIPVLFVVIAIVSIASNYKKAQEKRISDQKKRMETLKAVQAKDKAAEAKKQGTAAVVREAPAMQTVKRTNPSDARLVATRVNAQEIRKAVIMSEILNKPVSLRDQ